MKNQRNQILSVTLTTALWQTLLVTAIACATAAMGLIGQELIAGTSDAPHLGALLQQKHQLYFNWDDHTSDLFTFLTTAAGSLVAIFVWMKSLKDVHKDHTEKLWRLAEAIQIGAALVLALNISAIFHYLTDYQPHNTPRVVLLVFFFIAILLLTAEICSTIRIPLATAQKNYENALTRLHQEAAALQEARHPTRVPILSRWAGTEGRGRGVVLVAYLVAWALAGAGMMAIVIGIVKAAGHPSAPYVTTGFFIVAGIPVVAWLEYIRFNMNRRGGIPALIALFLLPTLYTYALVSIEDGWLAAGLACAILIAVLLTFSRAPTFGAHANMQVLREASMAHKLALVTERLEVLSSKDAQ